MRACTGIRVIAAAALAAAALAPGVAHAAAPSVQQLVAFRDGSALQKQVTARAATARVGSGRCAVGASTPLAALIRSAPGALKLKDYGSCSKRPRDAAGLYVASIRSERARGANGWVYKVGNKVASAGAGDPSGPFGRGRLRSGARVTWFFCHMSTRTASCQRTLGVKAVRDAVGVRVTVSAYDDRGRSKPAAGATVHAGTATATTDANGVARLTSDATNAWAEAPGVVRSFEERIDAG
jgi:hypothetical protein